ncbi:MAG: metallophosphoesterase [Anaerolineae bacterium]|nr:metallophosphoesterase [Anaerolineae bacterium]
MALTQLRSLTSSLWNIDGQGQHLLLAAIFLLGTAWVASRVWAIPSLNQRQEDKRLSLPALAILVFGVLDWGLLALLPILGLSFGSVGVPLLGITGVRWILSMSLALVQRLAHVPTVKSAKVGLILLWGLNLGILACEVWGLYIEPFRLTVTEIRVDIPTLPTGSSLRIVHLTDPHIEYTTKRERAILDTVTALEPDLIVLTGDYLNLGHLNDPITRRDTRDFLTHLHAPYGVYAVIGTVDTPDAMAALFDGLDNIKVLDDALQPISINGTDFYLLGVSNYTRARDRAALKELHTHVPGGAATVLLYHTPDLIETAAETGIDLYLAGHTHGGQIRVPFYGAIVTASAYGKQYEMGRYTVGATTLYVSRGLGMEGLGNAPRVRFLCPPEIVVLEVTGTGA